MILCICNNVRQKDKDRYHLIGTNCGKCIKQRTNENVQTTSNTTITVNSIRSNG